MLADAENLGRMWQTAHIVPAFATCNSSDLAGPLVACYAQLGAASMGGHGVGWAHVLCVAVAGNTIMPRLEIVAISVCALLVAPLSVSAATVSNQGGTVLVSKGEGFVPITGQAQLAPGSQIMVRPGGLATIAYASDCMVRVGSGVWLVQAIAPCAPGTTVIDFTGRMNQQPPADPPADPPVDPPPGDPPPGLNPVTGLVIGGVVVGGIVLGVVLSQNSDDKPASP